MKRRTLIVLVIASAALVVGRLGGNHVEDRSRGLEPQGRPRLNAEQVAALVKAGTCQGLGLTSEEYDQLRHEYEEANGRLDVNWPIMSDNERDYWLDVCLAAADKLGLGDDDQEDSGQ